MSCENLIKMLFLSSSRLWAVLGRCQAWLTGYCRSQQSSPIPQCRNDGFNIYTHIYPHYCSLCISPAYPHWTSCEFHLTPIQNSGKNLSFNSVEKGNVVDSAVVLFLQTWLWYSLLCLLLPALSSFSRLKPGLSSRPCSDSTVGRTFPDQLSHTSSLEGSVLIFTLHFELISVMALTVIGGAAFPPMLDTPWG